MGVIAEFYWKARPDSGACLTCGTSDTPRGFVDAVSEVMIRREDREIVGVVDLVLCGQCWEQGARMCGSATGAETQEMAAKQIELEEELLKTKDEVASWMQRYHNLIDAISNKDLIPDQEGKKNAPKRPASKRNP